jgi:NADH:ubiquinone oxidoreductase subunit 5 (subunit L)/multisubunit Na+/H+ antiporter MnhA subunit
LFVSGSVIHALHGEQDMRNMGGLKSNANYFATMLIASLAISEFHYSQVFLERRNLISGFPS